MSSGKQRRGPARPVGLILLALAGSASAQLYLGTVEARGTSPPANWTETVWWTQPTTGNPFGTGAESWFPSRDVQRSTPWALPPANGQWSTPDDPAPDPDNLCDNPVDIATGRKHEYVVDFAHATIEGLSFERTYNQAWSAGLGLMGRQWITNHDLKLSTARWYWSNARNLPPCYNLRPGTGCHLDHAPGVIFAHREGGDVVESTLHPGARDWRAVEWRGSRAAAAAFIKLQADGNWADRKLRLDWGDGRIETYTSEGLILARLGPDGTGLHYEYGPYGPTRIRHTSGLSMGFTYDTRGRISSVTDPAGGVHRYTYDASTRLGSVAFPDGLGTLQYHYDAQARYVGKSVGGVRFTTYAYDDESRVVESRKAGGVDLKRYAYSANATVRTNTLGKQETYHLQGGRIVGATGHASANCPATASTRTFDAMGQLTRTTDPTGVSTDFSYDDRGRVVRKAEAAATNVERVSTWEWDARNRLTRGALAGASATAYTYGADGRLASETVTDVVSGGTRTTTYTYTTHANGMLASITVDGPLMGDTILRTYSAAGDLLQVRNALGHATTYGGHDAMGRPARITTPAGAVTEFVRDARGRVVVERRFPNGSPVETRYVYGASGLLDAVQNPDGSAVLHHYDAAHRLIQEDITEPGGGFAVRRTTYNAMSQPIRVELGRDR